MPKTSTDVWQGFRRTRAAWLALVVIGPSAFALVMTAASHIREVRLAAIGFFVGLWVPAVMVLALTLRLWPCPRCGGNFTDFATKKFAGTVPSRGSVCAQCGLRFFQPPADA